MSQIQDRTERAIMRVVDCPASNGTKRDTTSIRANEMCADNLLFGIIAPLY